MNVMQKVLVNNVIPGSIISRDVYSKDGIILVSRGVAFREHFVKHFNEAGVKEIFVEENGQMTKDTMNHIRKSLHINDIVHEKTISQAQTQIKKTMIKISAAGSVNIARIGKLVEEIIDQLLEKQEFVFALSQLRSVDDYTYRHSVNVGVLSLVIGIDMSLDRDALRNLGIGAILHDIGKAVVPEDILKKPSSLTKEEFAEIKKHTDYGYEILKRTDVAEEAAQIALNHHEKYDGTGYQKGLKGTNIPLFSRIVAIADAYDAMSNDRVYQKKLSPDKVFKEITHLGDKHFDCEIMEKFARHLSIYPTGTGVILNTNHRGIVLRQNKLYPESPVVRVFRDERKDIRNLYVDIDLSITKHLYIANTF